MMWLLKKLTRRGLPILLAAMCAFLTLALACDRDRPQADASKSKAARPAAPLPLSGEAGNWTPAGDVQVFVGEGLFDHINGGADIYYEYGFDDLSVQQYNNEEKAVSLEVYRMTDPAAAFGIYTYNRHPSLSPAEVGSAGTIHPNGLFFWQDRYYVDVRQLGATAISPDEFLSLASTVSHKIGATAEEPAVMGLLPRENMVLQSEVFARGRIAINNQVYIAEQDLFELKDGEAAAIARYHIGQPELSLMIAEYKDDDASGGAFARFRTHYPGSGEEAEEFISIPLKPDKHFAVGKIRKNLVVVANANSGENALAAYAAASGNLKR